jgi:hypothetical protein
MKSASASRLKELLPLAMQVRAQRLGALSPNLEVLKESRREPMLKKPKKPDMMQRVPSR